MVAIVEVAEVESDGRGRNGAAGAADDDSSTPDEPSRTTTGGAENLEAGGETSSNGAEREAAESDKAAGNAKYLNGDWVGALACYTAALEHASPAAPQRAMYYANRAACHLKLGAHQQAVDDCTAALEIDPAYLKALLRRSAAREALEDLDGALADVQAVLDREPANKSAAESAAALAPRAEAKREAMKAEMFGKLKELGNSVLGMFGMSTDNFAADKDPATGSYSLRYVANPG